MITSPDEPIVPAAVAEEEEVWTVAPMNGPSGASDDLFLLHQSPVAHTEAEYIESVRTYIDMKFRVKHLGSPMADLNRRFCRLGKTFGAPVIGVVRILCSQGLVSVQAHRGNLIAFPTDPWNALLSDPITSGDIFQRICDETLRDIGKVIPVAKIKAAPKSGWD